MERKEYNENLFIIPTAKDANVNDSSLKSGPKPLSHQIAEKLVLNPKRSLLDEMIDAVPVTSNSESKQIIKAVEPPKNVAKTSTAANSGFQAGFLLSTPTQSKPKQTEPKPITNITSVRSSESKVLVLPEVQRAMEAQLSAYTPPELLEKCLSNPKLMAGFSDPHLMEVVREMQIDPRATLSKYKNDRRATEFLNEFTATLRPSVRSSDADVDRVLQDKELVDLLQDEQVQTKIKLCMSDPTSFRRLLAIDRVFAAQFKKLADAGLLAIE